MISPDQRTVFLYGENIGLTPKEFDILYLLASHPKKVYSVENIFQQVWNDAYFGGGNTVMVHIRTLRKKLGEDKRKNKLIKTVWGGIRSMAKMRSSFRTKIILLFAVSMLLAGMVTYLLFKGLQLYYHTMIHRGNPLAELRDFIESIGDFNFFFLLFILLSLSVFYILTKPYSAYFDEISTGIQYLALGDFKRRVNIQSNDEFGDIAQAINQASEKLEEAIQRGDFSENSKEQLVVNLAHDLRTPLTSVLGYLDLVLKDEKLTKEQVRHFLTIAFTKSQRLEKLIDELFEITRMNYGMLSIEKSQLI